MTILLNPVQIYKIVFKEKKVEQRESKWRVKQIIQFSNGNEYNSATLFYISCNYTLTSWYNFIPKDKFILMFFAFLSFYTWIRLLWMVRANLLRLNAAQKLKLSEHHAHWFGVHTILSFRTLLRSYSFLTLPLRGFQLWLRMYLLCSFPYCSRLSRFKSIEA